MRSHTCCGKDAGCEICGMDEELDQLRTDRAEAEQKRKNAACAVVLAQEIIAERDKQLADVNKLLVATNERIAVLKGACDAYKREIDRLGNVPRSSAEAARDDKGEGLGDRLIRGLTGYRDELKAEHDAKLVTRVKAAVCEAVRSIPENGPMGSEYRCGYTEGKIDAIAAIEGLEVEDEPV